VHVKSKCFLKAPNPNFKCVVLAVNLFLVSSKNENSYTFTKLRGGPAYINRDNSQAYPYDDQRAVENQKSRIFCRDWRKRAMEPENPGASSRPEHSATVQLLALQKELTESF